MTVKLSGLEVRDHSPHLPLEKQVHYTPKVKNNPSLRIELLLLLCLDVTWLVLVVDWLCMFLLGSLIRMLWKASCCCCFSSFGKDCCWLVVLLCRFVLSCNHCWMFYFGLSLCVVYQYHKAGYSFLFYFPQCILPIKKKTTNATCLHADECPQFVNGTFSFLDITIPMKYRQETIHRKKSIATIKASPMEGQTSTKGRTTSTEGGKPKTKTENKTIERKHTKLSKLTLY